MLKSIRFLGAKLTHVATRYLALLLKICKPKNRAQKQTRLFWKPLMAIVKPFAALRPKPELADRICELPYDVLSSDEAREMARGNPLSFFHVSKPEIDLPDGTDPYSHAVYAKGAENFQKLISQGALIQDSQPYYYLYRQNLKAHSQLGLVAVVSCEEYLQNVITVSYTHLTLPTILRV